MEYLGYQFMKIAPRFEELLVMVIATSTTLRIYSRPGILLSVLRVSPFLRRAEIASNTFALVYPSLSQDSFQGIVLRTRGKIFVALREINISLAFYGI